MWTNKILREKLIVELQEIKNKNQLLTISWDAGGDNTLVHLKVGEEYIHRYNDPVFGPFVRYFIEEFGLPNAGEYYNKGEGEISLTPDDKILFEYDEYAYEEDWEKETEVQLQIENSEIEDKWQIRTLLEKYAIDSIEIDGIIAFQTTKTTAFDSYYQGDNISSVDQKLQAIQEQITKDILCLLEGETLQDLEINYSGYINAEKILLQEVYLVHYKVDRDKQKARAYLLEFA